MPYTTEQPKCFARVGGRRILDWVRWALRSGGLDELVFVGGYRIDDVRRAYPDFQFRHNRDWRENNILVSLFYAEPDMGDGFVSSYADILYLPEAVHRLLDHPGDIVLAVDVDWRRRYRHRSQHPESDAEKVLARGDQVTRVARTIDPAAASGEFIGVAKFSPRGASRLRAHYRRLRDQLDDGPFQQATTFSRAYLIDLLQELIERGETIHMVPVDGDYFEIDTTEDFELARAAWPSVVSRAAPEMETGTAP